MSILKNYRHIICISITVILVVLGIFVFNGSVWRIIESGQDFGTSVAYWFLETFDIPNDLMPTVTLLPKAPPWSSGSVPKIFLPATWEAFAVEMKKYWVAWADIYTLLYYIIFLIEVVLNVVAISFDLFLILFVLKLIFNRYLSKQNNDDDKESKPLKRFKRIIDCIYPPVRRFFVDLYVFIRNSVYWKIWAFLLVIYTGALSICLELVAFLFYFSVSFDVLSIYAFFYKVVYDLAIFFEVIPPFITIVGAVILYEFICRKIGYNGLYHRERCNRGFLNDRGVVTIVWGEMGVGKTALITDCMLSAEVQLRDDAYEVILESDMKFPNFTWAITYLRL